MLPRLPARRAPIAVCPSRAVQLSTHHCGHLHLLPPIVSRRRRGRRPCRSRPAAAVASVPRCPAQRSSSRPCGSPARGSERPACCVQPVRGRMQSNLTPRECYPGAAPVLAGPDRPLRSPARHAAPRRAAGHGRPPVRPTFLRPSLVNPPRRPAVLPSLRVAVIANRQQRRVIRHTLAAIGGTWRRCSTTTKSVLQRGDF